MLDDAMLKDVARRLAASSSRGPRASVSVSVTTVCFVVIVAAKTSIIPAKRFHVHFIEDRADSFFVNTWCSAQCVLYDCSRGTPQSTTKRYESTRWIVARVSTNGASGGKSTIT